MKIQGENSCIHVATSLFFAVLFVWDMGALISIYDRNTLLIIEISAANGCVLRGRALC